MQTRDRARRGDDTAAWWHRAATVSSFQVGSCVSEARRSNWRPSVEVSCNSSTGPGEARAVWAVEGRRTEIREPVSTAGEPSASWRQARSVEESRPVRAPTPRVGPSNPEVNRQSGSGTAAALSAARCTTGLSAPRAREARPDRV